jgi:hypothetical protein
MATIDAQTMLQTDPVAQQLLQSAIPARLAYTWRDGTPRVVPMWFQWTGDVILMGCPPNAPKMKVLADRPHVAVTIDNNEWPYQVLLIRGIASVEPVDEIFPEYTAMARHYLGDDGSKQFLALARQTFSSWTRITIRPGHVRILDMPTRFPSAWSARGRSA